jgi:hypothetical protein
MKTVWLLGVCLSLATAPAAAQGHGQHHGAQPGAAPAAQPAQDDHGSEADQAAVLAVVERLFAALTAKDKAALLAEVVAEGRATGTMREPTPRVNSQTWPEFAEQISRAPVRLVERLVDPHVHVEGDIAMIWSRYEFEIDGRFSHCGRDHFDLVRMDGKWKVLNLTWTQRTEGCPGR